MSPIWRAMGRASVMSCDGPGRVDGSEEHETATMRTAMIAPHLARPTQLTPYYSSSYYSSSSSSESSSSSSATTSGSSLDSASSSTSSPVWASSPSTSSASSSSASVPNRKKLPLM